MKTAENESFVYKIENDTVTILKYKEDSSFVEFPQMIEGMPVTVLGEYILSGKSCERVVIPKGIKKIGRYGFYNCRKLKELSVTSDFMDLGSGAFTGCHNIKILNIHMHSVISNLKEILAEVHEEMVVNMTGEQEAILWFPEYYEEGVENTPARILMTQIHGSGLYYRNCFQGKQFNFMEYDRRFEMARAQENSNLLMELVVGRLLKPCHLLQEARKQYELFLKEHYIDISSKLIREKREEDLEWLLKSYPISEENRELHQKILDVAVEAQLPTIISMLMEDGRRFKKSKRKSFDL